MRSWRRVTGLGLFGLAMSFTAVGAASSDPIFTAVFGPLGLFSLAYAWWPRLVITDDALEVRNWRTKTIPWNKVRRVHTADQLPHLGRWWSTLHRLAYRPLQAKDVGYLGLCVRTDSGTVPVMAFQGASPWMGVRSSAPGWLLRTNERVTEAMRAAHRGDSPLVPPNQAR
jgi:hypothetical protein